jgi:hypothetical protein
LSTLICSFFYGTPHGCNDTDTDRWDIPNGYGWPNSNKAQLNRWFGTSQSKLEWAQSWLGCPNAGMVSWNRIDDITTET